MIINLRKKFKGSAILVLTVITATMIATIALSLVKLNSAATSTMMSNKTQVQAQQYALAEASLVRAMRYAEIPTNDYYARINGLMEPIAGSNFTKKITIGSEVNFSGSASIKQRTVNIKIYHNTDIDNPLINLDVPRYNREKNYMPVGAIVAWVGSGTPNDANGKWLECNGTSTGSYPVNNSNVNVNTNYTPNFNGRYLAGTTSTSEICLNQDDNLPNITGSVALGYVVDLSGSSSSVRGAFSLDTYGTALGMKSSGAISTTNRPRLNFDASRANPIYSNTNVVRPKTTKVRYFIKAE